MTWAKRTINPNTLDNEFRSLILIDQLYITIELKVILRLLLYYVFWPHRKVFWTPPNTQFQLHSTSKSNVTAQEQRLTTRNNPYQKRITWRWLVVAFTGFTGTENVSICFTAHTVSLDHTAVTLISLGSVYLLSVCLTTVLSAIVNEGMGRRALTAWKKPQ